MTDEQKDLTRQEALALAKAKWGKEAFVSYGSIIGYRVGRQMNGRRGRIWQDVAGHSYLGWRKACERAGLLPSPDPGARTATGQ
jgi:hypothetical protein